MRHVLWIALLATLVMLPGPTWSQSAQRGKQLHDLQCQACHSAEIYERTGSPLGSLDELREAVVLWLTETQAEWTAEDVEDVTWYLNEVFYNFHCPAKRC